jgi:hypothetical protein
VVCVYVCLFVESEYVRILLFQFIIIGVGIRNNERCMFMIDSKDKNMRSLRRADCEIVIVNCNW